MLRGNIAPTSPKIIQKIIFSVKCNDKSNMNVFTSSLWENIQWGFFYFDQFIWMLGNFSCFCSHLLTFSKLTFSQNSFRNTIRVSNSLDSEQDRHSVGPDLRPNCLQRLSVDDKSRR